MIKNLIINQSLYCNYGPAVCVNCYNLIHPMHRDITKDRYEAIFNNTHKDKYYYNIIGYASYNCSCGEFYWQIAYYDNMIIKNINLIIKNFSISWNYDNKKCYLNDNVIPFDTFSFDQIINQDLKNTKQKINKYLVLL